MKNIAPVLYPYLITSPYGHRKFKSRTTGETIEGFHDGIDFISKTGSNNVVAIADGFVVYDQDDYNSMLRWIDKHHSAGNMIIIKHKIDDKIYYARYLHLVKNDVYKKERVTQGQIVGVYGDVGYSFGAHVHFDLYTDKWKKIDPTFLFDK